MLLKRYESTKGAPFMSIDPREEPFIKQLKFKQQSQSHILLLIIYCPNAASLEENTLFVAF